MQHYRIRGVMLTAGYIDDRGSDRLPVIIEGPTLWAWDEWGRCIDREAGPLYLDCNGMLCHAGASAGYGFLPDPAEIMRLRGLGAALPSLP